MDMLNMPDKANYILYSIVYIFAGIFILRGFIKMVILTEQAILILQMDRLELRFHIKEE